MEHPDHWLDVRGLIAALDTMYIPYSKYLDLNSDLKVFKNFSCIICLEMKYQEPNKENQKPQGG